MTHRLFVPFQNLKPEMETNGSWWITPQDADKRSEWVANAKVEEARLRASREGLKVFANQNRDVWT